MPPRRHFHALATEECGVVEVQVWQAQAQCITDSQAQARLCHMGIPSFPSLEKEIEMDDDDG